MRWMFVAAVTAIAATAAQPAEKPIDLKQGAGRDKVIARCGACHSLDYIPMNAGFLDAAGWSVEVAKMINAFGAPVDQANAKAIAEYLGTNYGPRPQPDGPRAGDGNPPRGGYEARGVRRRGSRVLHAASRRRPARGPFDGFFAMFVEPWTCKPAKRGAKTLACETQTRRASEPGRRQVRR